MMRSMFSGVSGLKNHQIKMDVLGNNVANVNTTGFKASRVTFQDMLSQSMSGGTAPSSGDLGGMNPSQVGLGMIVGSIDTQHTQGNLGSTGNATDVAIQGKGFFVVDNGMGSRYTRDGAFSVDSAGNLVNPANGYKVQGWNADSDGVITISPTVEDISISQTQIAKATSSFTLSGNMDAVSTTATQGTLARSAAVLAGAASGTDLVTGLYDSSLATPVNLGISAGDIVHVTDGTDTENITVTSGMTYTALATALQTALNTLYTAGVTVSINADGSLRVANASGGAFTAGTDIYVGTAGSNTVFEAGVPSLASLANGATADGHALDGAAQDTDLLTDLTNSAGTSLGLVDGDVISVSVTKGGSDIDAETLAIDSTTTYADLLDFINQTYGIASGESYSYSSDTVDSGVTALATTGGVQVCGNMGEGNALTEITITAASSAGTSRSNFDTAMGDLATTLQDADGDSISSTVTVYDSQGAAHAVRMVFTKTAANTWNWSADCADDVSGGRCITNNAGTRGAIQTLSFTSAGVYSTHTGTIYLDLDGASDVSATPTMSDLSQFSGTSNVNLSEQDGYAVGTLDKFSIGSDGVITGIYTNGMTKDLAQIAVAKFNNPSGLTREGNNVFAEGTNSGTASVGVAGSNGNGTISSGVLEMSNVDLAQTFTDMIVTQRGFQANAKIITTSDDMLLELVNLKR